MPRFTISVALRMLCGLLILVATGTTIVQWATYRSLDVVYPATQTIAGIPVGGLNRPQAAERIRAAYALPVEVRYQDSVFRVQPEDVGFRLNLEAMLERASPRRPSFWEFLWERPAGGNAIGAVPLLADLDAARLRAYIVEQIAARYDRTPTAAQPVLGGVDFVPGQAGMALDVEDTLRQLENGLHSPTQRIATIRGDPVPPGRPELTRLRTLLQSILQVDGFEGLAEISLADLRNGLRLDFASVHGSVLPAEMAFTAASTIKIPVMVSVFRRTPEPMPESVLQLVRQMIEASDNPSTDQVVQTVIDLTRGPLEVTRDLRSFGYQNTYWSGYFYDGAPLLELVQTPANQRTEFNTHPDVYNQTTAADMADLLAQIHACAQDGSGKLTATFPGEITQAKCRQMIEILKRNKLPVLIKAGLPEGTAVGHKHGWITGPDGLVHTFSDVALVQSPGGDYALAIYLYSDQQLLFDPANLLFARLSRAVYNYMQLPLPGSGG
ncbi:MAG: class A beta-lactamase-related serine hydrolase [Anaerolineaceae bacterium]|nr:class A beta-lactamase-related serine hydrolase [Anaerolineaceae bacterium]